MRGDQRLVTRRQRRQIGLGDPLRGAAVTATHPTSARVARWEDLGRANDSIWARGVGGIVDHLCILWSLEYAPNILGQRFVIRSLRR